MTPAEFLVGHANLSAETTCAPRSWCILNDEAGRMSPLVLTLIRLSGNTHMTPWQEHADALTLRMAQDMKLRNLAQKTIDAYTSDSRTCQAYLQSVPSPIDWLPVRQLPKWAARTPLEQTQPALTPPEPPPPTDEVHPT